MPQAVRGTVGWGIAWWILLGGWVLGGGLTMARVRGGFLTSYLADLTNPPWLYIVFRELAGPKARVVRPLRWLGATPERAAASIFLVGTVAELKTFWWPAGPFAGTFDPLDIAAYGVGLAICWAVERRQGLRDGAG